jgi:RNA polymerase sigma factor (sigma-70 family)
MRCGGRFYRIAEAKSWRGLARRCPSDTNLRVLIHAGLTRLADDRGSPEDWLAEHDSWVHINRALKSALGCLSKRERRLLQLHYEAALPFRAIGERLGITESRVSQLHQGAVARLRRRLLSSHNPMFKSET